MDKNEKELSGQEELSISELLDMLAFDPTNQETRKTIEKIILRDYELKPSIRYNKSIKDLNDSNFHQIVKEGAESARTCARIIIERLSDFDDINTIHDVEIITNHQIGITKKLSDI